MKTINAEEFNFLNRTIGIFDSIVHEKGDFLIDNNEAFTNKVKALREAVDKFEEETGFTLKVTIEKGDL